MYITF